MSEQEIEAYEGFEYVRTYEAGERFPNKPMRELDFSHAMPNGDCKVGAWTVPEPIDKCWIGNGSRCAVYRVVPNAELTGKESTRTMDCDEG